MAPRPLLVAALLAVACGDGAGVRGEPSTLIVGALVVDGSGAPARAAAVRLRGGSIEAVGELAPTPTDEVLEAHGLVLAPGFIDTHSHHDEGLEQEPGALAAVSQGITTIVVGQDGFSPYPLSDFFARLTQRPAAVNVAAYAGHNTLRAQVMGDDFARRATTGEMARMRELLRLELDAGALGLSSGLEYDPGIHSDTPELLELARETARAGGRYISHMRSEDRELWAALDELIAIGREAGLPVQISHMKLAMRSLWGRADELIDRLDRARAAGVDVTADVYPYTYWQSTMTVLFPERDFTDRAVAEFALRELVPAEGMILARFDPQPSYVGKSLTQVAVLRGGDEVSTYLALIAESQALARETGGETESVIARSMDPADVARLLAWPHTNLCTDGSLRGRHPRGFGSFPRFLGRHVGQSRVEGPLQDPVVGLEQAVRKCSALAAEHAGLEGRGVIAAGAAADLVLFDPERILDRATIEDPTALAVGIERVWVAGQVVFRDGEATGARPGRVLRRGVKR